MNIAIVTGASSGMGKNAVLKIGDRFGSLDEIWVIARREDKLNELKTMSTTKIRVFCGDVSSQELIKKLEETLEQEKPTVRILFEAAGYGKLGCIGDVPLEEEAGMVDTNCNGIVKITHVVLPYLKEKSRVILIASSAAFLPQPVFAIYSATKAFVMFYAKALSRELSDKHITVCCVCPGPVQTDFFTIAQEKHDMAFYKRFFMSSPDKVVDKAIKDAMLGKSMSVYGLHMRFVRVVCKIVPWDILIKFFPKK